MKKTEQPQAEAEMQTKYDFTGKEGVWGRYYKAYRQGHTVCIQETDGTVSVHTFTLEEGAVMLDPDVREYFPTSESVNQILRSLIAIAPAKKTARKSISVEQ